MKDNSHTTMTTIKSAQTLPFEVLEYIFELADAKTLKACTGVCRVLRPVALDLLKKYSIIISGNVKYSELDTNTRDFLVRIDGDLKLDTDEDVCLPLLQLVGGTVECTRSDTTSISLGSLTRVVGSLILNQCNSLVKLNLPSLIKVESNMRITYCDMLESLVNLNNLTTIKGRLTIVHCKVLESLDILINLITAGGGIHISNCDALGSISGLSSCALYTSVNYANFEELCIRYGGLSIMNCHSLTSIDNLHNIKAVEDLYISDCSALISIGGLSSLTNIYSRLSISNCPSLISIEGLSNLTSVGALYITNCTALTSVDSLSSLTNIDEEFLISKCTSLKSTAELLYQLEVCLH